MGISECFFFLSLLQMPALMGKGKFFLSASRLPHRYIGYPSFQKGDVTYGKRAGWVEGTVANMSLSLVRNNYSASASINLPPIIF